MRTEDQPAQAPTSSRDVTEVLGHAASDRKASGQREPRRQPSVDRRDEKVAAQARHSRHERLVEGHHQKPRQNMRKGFVSEGRPHHKANAS